MEVEGQQRRQDGIDANPPWNAREAGPAIRRTATRPAQWYSWLDPSQERPRRRQQRKLTTHGYSESLMLVMPGRRETEKNVLVDVKELETNIYIYIYVLSCSEKQREATLVANVKQYAMMRAMQNEEYQEPHEVIEYMNERQEKLVSTMERQQKLMGEVLELRDKCANKLGSWTTGSRRRKWSCWRKSSS